MVGGLEVLDPAEDDLLNPVVGGFGASDCPPDVLVLGFLVEDLLGPDTTEMFDVFEAVVASVFRSDSRTLL